MNAKILNGKMLSEEIFLTLSNRIETLKKSHEFYPGLAVVLVGDNPASRVYVRNKQKAAEKVGMKSELIQLPSNTTQEELLNVIESLNLNHDIHGVLVQLPLPKHIDEQLVLQKIDYEKDVDGFHPMNVGKFVLNEQSALPCTPFGIMTLLKHYDINVSGKHAVVIGRSNIVGKPMGLMLLKEDATVTYVHSKTKNIEKYIKDADVLVVAVGMPHFVTKDMIKEGAIVIDVGINRTDDGKIVGNVCQTVSEKASYLTPVPGGVGPMTIAMLLQQTVDLAEQQLTKRQG